MIKTTLLTILIVSVAITLLEPVYWYVKKRFGKTVQSK